MKTAISTPSLHPAQSSALNAARASATQPSHQPVSSLLRSLAVTAIAAVAALGIGLMASQAAVAQDAPSRTIATGSGIPLSSDAPDRYTVKKGDTLWDIAKVFLRDPWYWPEIWYVNPQIKNPHLIFPGDVLELVSIEGRPQVKVAERGPIGTAAEAQPTRGNTERLSPHVRSTPITAAVTAIPYEAVAAFLGKPTILTKEQIKTAPYVMALQDRHLIGGEDIDVYARGIPDAVVGTRYSYVHIGDPLRDPETNKILGYRGIYAGEGTVLASGDPAKLSAEKTAREVLRGDKLFAEQPGFAMDFIPHPAPADLHGSVMAVNGVSIAGNLQVIAINRGKRNGIEPGHVIALYERGEKVRDTFQEGDKAKFWSFGHKVKLPDERIGVAMVFRTYDRVSFALIMEATHPARLGDLVKAP